jgi:hypothetical protein
MGVLVICTLYSEWSFFTLTEVFPCFILSCKANARVNLAKTGHIPHSSKLVVICVVLFVICVVYFVICVVLFVICVALCIVFVYMCTVLLPPGESPIALKKYIKVFNQNVRWISFLGSCKIFFRRSSLSSHDAKSEMSFYLKVGRIFQKLSFDEV